MSYITLELKTNDSGGTAAETIYSGSDKHYAEKKFYETMAIAATSGRKCHSCVILDEKGMLQAQGCYEKNDEQTDEA